MRPRPLLKVHRSAPPTGPTLRESRPVAKALRRGTAASSLETPMRAGRGSQHPRPHCWSRLAACIALIRTALAGRPGRDPCHIPSPGCQVCAMKACTARRDLEIKLLGLYDAVNIKLDKTRRADRLPSGCTPAPRELGFGDHGRLHGRHVAWPMAPALWLGLRTREFVDLDGPLLLEKGP